MSTPNADASEAAAAVAETPVVDQLPVDETEAAAPADAEVAAPEEAVEPANDATEVDDAPKKRGRKRKASVTEEKKAAADDATVNGDAAEPTDKPAEKPQAKKPAKKAKAAAAPKKKLGRPRKNAKEDSETEDEGENEVNKRVDALPEEIKAKFGSIVWAKMVGYPFWPGLIADPRRLEGKLQAGALKDLDSKYMVCFYHTKNFAPMLFKNVESWDDKTFAYREGHPAKDAKAPKRRSQLMAAIEEADKDAVLPIDERMCGLLKVVEVVVEPTPEDEEDEEPPASKRKPGRPAGSKNKPKTTEAAASAEKPKAKRGRKKTADADDANAEEEAAPGTPGDDDSVTEPALSKDEIKAKVASRKAPSKKKAATAEEKSAAAAAKKTAKPSTSTKGEKAELDSKRKKEIELVVPRKSVKSADIREATDEAARKKSGPREKPKDKGDYKVGNLTHFAGKMNRLHANESSKNNDELIQMLTQFFDEKTVYRSDMERSGVAAVVALLRKSANPTVSQTASAVRKHLIKVLVNDVDAPASKKTKANGEAEGKPAKKQKTADASPEQSSSPVEASVGTPEISEKTESPAEVTTHTTTERPSEETPSTDDKPEPVADEPSAATESHTSELPTETVPTVSEEKVESTEEAAKPEQTTPASPLKTDTPPASSGPKPDPTGDKSRMNCIEMLKKSLASTGDKSADIAREIEAQVFERFNESNDEYKACARSITFGLKKNAKVRERLASGSLHALELAYSHEQLFKDA